MSTRLKVLKNSLQKKEARVDSLIENHFATVRESNGQPLNDKRNGAATLKKWDRQNDTIRNQIAEVEKTKNAIEREERKLAHVAVVNDGLPLYALDMVKNGELIQWQKHPETFFVPGVEKGRIAFTKNKWVYRYGSEIPVEQRPAFIAVLNKLVELQKLACENE